MTTALDAAGYRAGMTAGEATARVFPDTATHSVAAPAGLGSMFAAGWRIGFANVRNELARGLAVTGPASLNSSYLAALLAARQFDPSPEEADPGEWWYDRQFNGATLRVIASEGNNALTMHGFEGHACAWTVEFSAGPGDDAGMFRDFLATALNWQATR